MIKTLYAASATSSYHTAIYGDGWEYDISKVNIPVFLAAGTGAWDAGTATDKSQVNDDKNGIAQGICPLWSLQENYNLLPETIDKVIARKKNVDHGDSHLQFDGYMTGIVYVAFAGRPERRKSICRGYRRDIDKSTLPGSVLVEAERAKGHTVIMIGDGINDSLALSKADVGIAISDGAAAHP